MGNQPKSDNLIDYRNTLFDKKGDEYTPVNKRKLENSWRGYQKKEKIMIQLSKYLSHQYSYLLKYYP